MLPGNFFHTTNVAHTTPASRISNNQKDPLILTESGGHKMAPSVSTRHLLLQITSPKDITYNYCTLLHISKLQSLTPKRLLPLEVSKKQLWPSPPGPQKKQHGNLRAPPPQFHPENPRNKALLGDYEGTLMVISTLELKGRLFPGRNVCILGIFRQRSAQKAISRTAWSWPK